MGLRILPHRMRGLLLLLVLALLIPILVVQGWTYYQWFSSRREMVLQADLELARAVAAAFREYVQDIGRQEVAIGGALTGLKPYSPEQIHEFLALSVREYPSVDYWLWMSPEGKALAASDPEVIGVDVSDRTYFQQILAGREWVISDLLRAKVTGKLTFIVARGIRSEHGTIEGVVVAAVDPERLAAEILDIRRTGDKWIAIFDRQGTVVCIRPRIKMTMEQRKWADADDLLAEALAGKETAGTRTLPVGGGRRTVARVPVPELGWVAGSSRPASAVSAAIAEGMVLTFGIIGVVLLVSIFLAMLISRRIIARIRVLKEHAAAIGAGNLQHRAETAGIGEFEELAGSVNAMAAQLQRRREEVDKATAELVRSNRELEAFSYSVAHDLRAPLRAIDGYAHMMSEDCAAKLDAEGNRRLDLIRASAQKMGKLIDDLLAFSRMGRREMSISPVNMTQLARTVWEEMRGAIGERAVKVVIDEMPGARADRAMIQVVFTNLLSNALKFTAPRREAAIEIGATPGDPENTYHVRDNGVGFDEQYAHKLFGVFQRLHREEEFPGTGVGLALVQRIIQRHGGRVRAEGKTDEGATFYFTLPRTGDRP